MYNIIKITNKLFFTPIKLYFLKVIFIIIFFNFGYLFGKYRCAPVVKKNIHDY